MKPEDIHEALNLIDDDMVESTDKLRNAHKAKKRALLRVISAAACVVLAVTATFPFVLNRSKCGETASQMITYNDSYYMVCDSKKDKISLKVHGVKKNITAEDAGKRLAFLKHENNSNLSNYIESTEETDVVLYEYAPAPCEGVYVICENGKYSAVIFCNLIMPDSESYPITELFEIYSVKSADDIKKIRVIKDPYNKRFTDIFRKRITKEDEIVKFYNYLVSLDSYTFDEYEKNTFGQIKENKDRLKASSKSAENFENIMIETRDGLKFYIGYDKFFGWFKAYDIHSYYKVSGENEERFYLDIEEII